MYDELCPFAVWFPGPDWKTGYLQVGRNSRKQGEVDHSMEGWKFGAHQVLLSPTPSSWHFSIYDDGTLEQHYTVSTNCWHCADADGDGGIAGNISLVGIEHEGIAGSPLTSKCLNTSIRLTSWLMQEWGFARVARYPFMDASVWCLAEHNEVGDTSTACPSGRIPWGEKVRRLQITNNQQATTELDERRAGAILQYNLLTEYRTRFASSWAVELLLNDGTPTGILIPTPRRAP